MPVIVTADEGSDDQATVERLIGQYAENEHRSGLTNAEKVGVMEQLAAFGVSPAQIAKRTKTNRGDVDGALAVAKSRPGPRRHRTLRLPHPRPGCRRRRPRRRNRHQHQRQTPRRRLARMRRDRIWPQRGTRQHHREGQPATRTDAHPRPHPRRIREPHRPQRLALPTAEHRRYLTFLADCGYNLSEVEELVTT